MKFSELYNVNVGLNDEWFDPVLSIDTHLFIDPFLLYASEVGHFAGSHQEVVAFFNSVFQLIARTGGDKSSILWQKAIGLLQFPEVEELCLGYTGAGTRGSGSGFLLSHVVASALWEAVQAGLIEITHFEEIHILREGIGADRISDITAALIRSRLVSYTQMVSERHQVPLAPVHYPRGYYDVNEQRWFPLHTHLPRNPYSTKPILLVPRQYLRSLPTINSDDFWEYCYSNENETLRIEYSQDITRHVDKKKIIDFARRHPEMRRRYIAEREVQGSEPYDLEEDPKGLTRWYNATALYCQQYPLSLIVQSDREFRIAVDSMVEEFQRYVEQNEGWRLLWNENGTPRREEAAQLLFLGIIKHYCKANNIDISREADIGRGPVDFKVSHGYQLRALLELKLAKNTKFWDGLERQLPTYQRAENIVIGYFIVIVYTDRDLEKIRNIQARVNAVRQTTGYDIKEIVVDARTNPASASRL